MAVVTGTARANLQEELYPAGMAMLNPLRQRKLVVNPFLAGATTPGSQLAPAPPLGTVLPR